MGGDGLIIAPSWISGTRMTEVEIDVPRADAVELARRAFDLAPSFVAYTVEGDDERLVGQLRGGISSADGKVVVRIPTSQTGESTTLTVTADRSMTVVFTGNPWKYKAEYLAELRDLRDAHEATGCRDALNEIATNSRSTYDGGSGAPVGEPDDRTTGSGLEGAVSAADAWMRTARLAGLLLLGLLGLVALAVIVAVVLP